MEVKVILSYLTVLLFCAVASTSSLIKDSGNKDLDAPIDVFQKFQKIEDDNKYSTTTKRILSIKDDNKDDLKKALQYIWKTLQIDQSISENEIIDKLMEQRSSFIDGIPQEGRICKMCKQMADEFKSLIDTKDKRDFILVIASSGCRLLPHILEGPCSVFINGIAHRLLDSLSRITSDHYCALICIFSEELQMDDNLKFNEILDRLINYSE